MPSRLVQLSLFLALLAVATRPSHADLLFSMVQNIDPPYTVDFTRFQDPVGPISSQKFYTNTPTGGGVEFHSQIPLSGPEGPLYQNVNQFSIDLMDYTGGLTVVVDPKTAFGWSDSVTQIDDANGSQVGWHLLFFNTGEGNPMNDSGPTPHWNTIFASAQGATDSEIAQFNQSSFTATAISPTVLTPEGGSLSLLLAGAAPLLAGCGLRRHRASKLAATHG